MGGCAAAWQAVRGAPESREHVVTEAGGGGWGCRGWHGGARVGVGIKAPALHLNVALRVLALLGDVRAKDGKKKRAEGTKESLRTQSSHSCDCFHGPKLYSACRAKENKEAAWHLVTPGQCKN